MRERDNIHEKIQKLWTVEEKQIALNMPRYYGFPCVILNEDKVPYNALPLIQFYTKSHFISVEKLPDPYLSLESTATTIAQEIKYLVEEMLITEHEGVKHEFTPNSDKYLIPQEEDAFSKRIVRQINRIISNNMVDKAPHLLMAQFDYDTTHEAFWFVGGIEPPKNVIEKRKRRIWMKNQLYEPTDRAVQYLGSPILAVRSNLPLKPLLDYKEAKNPEFTVPKYTYYPQTTGYTIEHRHGTNKPGFWPGDSDEFGLISFHGRGHILARKNSFGPEDNLEALHCQALTASYGWLLGQASYQGFTTYNDLTYPLVTQTVITNGQLWSFYAYQLNTILMHNEKVDENPKHNICYGTKPMKLYEKIENGKLIDFNEDVLKTLIQFYLNAPTKRKHNMKPYLGKEIQVAADIEDDKKRCWLEDTYKHIMSNRPRHNLVPEMYHWEWIYKVLFNTRFFERKVRFFERNINPFARKLNDHLPPYIPKQLSLEHYDISYSGADKQGHVVTPQRVDQFGRSLTPSVHPHVPKVHHRDPDKIYYKILIEVKF
ncbi:28S ribosomal protein S30, mitochondrial [Eumeta japonica]|uniref:28S ribosomal protein S30, mitochondrial n=1 Tax=Eumeta variegata TaxID=151549 RepID=A0A4C1ZXI2_EUMVA|nr:28S ribosomal protein S30, mitochondrial [Eumeta japonica]